MSRIYWDTMLFAYWTEGNPDFGPRMKEIHRAMQDRGDELCTSIFTLGELLTGPRKRGDEPLVQRLMHLFRSDEVTVLRFTLETGNVYSQIRAQSNVLPADAIHLATAAEAAVDLLLTNDRKLQKLRIPGIHFVSGLEGRLF